MGQARQMLERHGVARHRGPHSQEGPGQELRGRPQHIVFSCTDQIILGRLVPCQVAVVGVTVQAISRDARRKPLWQRPANGAVTESAALERKWRRTMEIRSRYRRSSEEGTPPDRI